MFAAWGAWNFRYYGHVNVKLLDGGRNKWEADNRPLGSRLAIGGGVACRRSRFDRQSMWVYGQSSTRHRDVEF
jgi:3-mercaptopyruvate sulfurtransferase SseA